jgi:outer membrane biosynthesis protein TonB
MKTIIITIISAMILTTTCDVNAKNITSKDGDKGKNKTNTLKSKTTRFSERKIKKIYELKTFVGELAAKSKSMLINEMNYLYSLIISGTASDSQVARYNSLKQETKGSADLAKSPQSILKQAVSSSIEFPAAAIEKQIEGAVFVEFTVTDEGKIVVLNCNSSEGELQTYVFQKLSETTVEPQIETVGQTFLMRIDFELETL